MQMLWLDPAIAAGVLRRLARLQADTVDPQADAAPGKILHEMRGGEMAALHEVPFAQYYGTVDATPLFVMLAGAVRAAYRRLGAHPRAVAGDRKGAGMDRRPGRSGRRRLHRIRPRRRRRALPTRDGRIPTTRSSTPTAAWPRARSRSWRCRATPTRRGSAASACARGLGMHERAAALAAQAERPAPAASSEAFWCDDIGFYAVALDGAKSPCRVRTSNPGHALFTGIADARARRAASPRSCWTPDFYSGWGMRTVARGEARYNPMSYHNGSIWPHDNAMHRRGACEVRRQARHRSTSSRG